MISTLAQFTATNSELRLPCPLDDPALWQRYKIGFADRTLGLRIPGKNRKQGAEIRTRLAALGVFRDNGREHL